MDNTKDLIVLESESGLFYVDGNGIAQRFEALYNNPFFEIMPLVKDNPTVNKSSIRTFIVPKGVKGFASDFMRETRIVERFELPEGLISIGNNSLDYVNEFRCVFAECILPEVIIPQSVQEIGSYAFGQSHIDVLQLPVTLQSPYGRQFKDSYIGKLRLPKEWENIASLDKYNRLKIHFHWEERTKYAYLCWPSTYIGELEFY